MRWFTVCRSCGGNVVIQDSKCIDHTSRTHSDSKKDNLHPDITERLSRLSRPTRPHCSHRPSRNLRQRNPQQRQHKMNLVVFGIHDWQVEGKLRCNGLVLHHPSLHRWNERERPHRVGLINDLCVSSHSQQMRWG